MFAAGIAMMVCASGVMAQSDNSAGSPSTASPTTPASSNQASPGSDEAETPVYGLVKPEDGTILPLPPGTTYPEFLEWAAARRGNGFGINSVTISGQATDSSQIELNAEIVIMVRRPEAVRVPLAFTEAVLTSVEHSGTGDASYEPYSDQTGHTWSLQGRGEHRLRLTLLVPLTTQVDTTQLTLTTPANAAVTTLNLDVPAGSEVFTETDKGLLRRTIETESATSVEWVGTGGGLHLSWRPRPVTADPADLASSCTIFPSVTGKSVQLRATLRVTSAKGRISVLRVALPDGFSLVDVTGKRVRNHSEEASGDERFAIVTLSEPAAEPIEITMRVSAPLPADGRIAINGFSLPNVPGDSQTGVIALEKASAYHIAVVERSDGIEQLEMIEPGPLADSEAFEFTAQPFQVELQIDAIPPVLSVTPDVVVQVSPDRLDLDARFSVAVNEGEIRELRLDWAATDWSIPRVGSGGVQEFRRGSNSSPPIDISVPASTSSFVIPLRANRPYEGEDLEIPIPRITVPGVMPVIEPAGTVIALQYPDSVVVELDPADGLIPLTDSPRVAGITALSKPGPNDRMEPFLAPAGLESVTLHVRRLSREVAVSSLVSVRPRGDQLVVEQRLDFDVQFDTISELPLTVPESIPVRQIEFYDGAGRRLAAETVESGTTEGTAIRLPLERAMIGPFSVSARFETATTPSEGTSSDVPMPLIVPTESAFETVELQIGQMPHHLATVVGTNWVRQQSTENIGRDRWTAADVANSPVLRLQPRPDDPTRTSAISRMLVQTIVERDGSLRTVADCRMDQPPEMLTIHFPPGVDPEGFRWRGRTIVPEIIREPEGLIAELELDRGERTPVLSIAFRDAGAGAIGLAASRQIRMPQFGQGIGVEHTVWRITLPESQHLFALPDGYEAGFAWGARGFWSSHTSEPFHQIGTWFGDDVTTLGPEFNSGHQYTFSRHGEPITLEWNSLSRSLAVLLGAGSAIILGYLFASGLLPRRRSVLIGLGTFLLLLWAFFPNQMQIFLQPALFGLTLVGMAMGAEWLLKKRQEQLASESPSGVEFVTILPGDGSTSAPPASIGSEDPTVLRTMRPTDESASQDSGYGPVEPSEQQPQPSARD